MSDSDNGNSRAASEARHASTKPMIVHSDQKEHKHVPKGENGVRVGPSAAQTMSLEPLGGALDDSIARNGVQAQNKSDESSQLDIRHLKPETQAKASSPPLTAQRSQQTSKSNNSGKSSSVNIPSHSSSKADSPCLTEAVPASSSSTLSRLEAPATLVDPTRTAAQPGLTNIKKPRPAKRIDAQTLADRLVANDVLVVDVRNVARFEQRRLRHSININLPSLLVKRFKRGNTACFSLDAFVTTDLGKDILDHRSRTRGYKDDVVIVGDQPERRDIESLNLGSVLLSVLEAQGGRGDLFFLEETLEDAVSHEARLDQCMVEGEQEDERPESGGEGVHEDGQGQRQATASNNNEPSSPIRVSLSPPRSPTTPTTPPRTPNSIASSGGRPRPRLKRIDTSESLLTAPRSRASSGSSSVNSRSPAAAIANLRVDPDCGGSQGSSTGGRSRGSSVQSVCSMQSAGRSPGRLTDADSVGFTANGLPVDPTDVMSSTNQLGLESPSTPAATFTDFDVSTIIENLLFLGPEPTKLEHLDKLESLGVKVVVNLAIECQDLKHEIGTRFEAHRVPMRDIVDETAVQQSFEKACDIIEQAHAASKPVYCHCRAGKSRSVAIVLAYLVKQRHYSLKRAYDHVSSRRKDIQPNIGFLGELMLWEQSVRGTTRSKGFFGPCTPAVEVVSFT
ncbi:hypothetical protein OIV83_004774 [Microbotryomycetes sp. JL201]|nr:hypothetical protein OIV83_004774 [Microbotryomycetes sp. JL201]